MLVGAAAAMMLAPSIEIMFFGGDVRQWLTTWGATYDQRNSLVVGIAMGFAVVAGIVRLLRSSMLEALSTDYVHMARAKGLSERKVVAKHALRNALIPVLSLTGLIIAGFMNGSVVIENVCAWPGIGSLVLDAVKTRDYPVVQGVVLVTVLIYIVINLCVDLLYGWLDPRTRREVAA